MASDGPSRRPTPASTNCLIVGACADPADSIEGSKEQGRQERMKESIEADISRVLKFVAKHRSRPRRPGARHHRDRIVVSDILLNKDMLRHLKQGLKARSGEHERRVLEDATVKPYESKDEVREAIRDFLESATADQHLLLVMTGHGDRTIANDPEEEPEIEQAFCIPNMYSTDDDKYSDTELTEDINECLKVGQRLYILMNACYSGGMLNLWQLDARKKWVALFASAGPTLTSEWCTFKVKEDEAMPDDEDEDDEDEDDEGEDDEDEDDEDEDEDVEDEEVEDEEVGGRKYDFFASFFENAKVGRPLMEIAKHVLLDTQDTVEQIRPAFVTTDPAIAGAPFLVTPPKDED